MGDFTGKGAANCTRRNEHSPSCQVERPLPGTRGTRKQEAGGEQGGVTEHPLTTPGTVGFVLEALLSPHAFFPTGAAYTEVLETRSIP